MELLVHGSTSGLLLVAGSLELVPVVPNVIDVHMIMVILAPHLLLWAMTIFVKAHVLRMLWEGIASFQMLCSGMEGVVRVVAGAASSTIHHGSPRT